MASLKRIFFIYFWLHWVSVALHGLFLVLMSRAPLLRGVLASHCGSFSWHAAQALGAQVQ